MPLVCYERTPCICTSHQTIEKSFEQQRSKLSAYKSYSKAQDIILVIFVHNLTDISIIFVRNRRLSDVNKLLHSQSP